MVTQIPELKPLKCIIDMPQPILDNDTLLSKALGGKPKFAYGQPPNLEQIHPNNEKQQDNVTNVGTRLCNKCRCLLWSYICTESTITGPKKYSKIIIDNMTHCSFNVIYVITNEQCPTGFYIGQMRQALLKRINGHKFDLRTQTRDKAVSFLLSY